jgi:hypothetical protein
MTGVIDGIGASAKVLASSIDVANTLRPFDNVKGNKFQPKNSEMHKKGHFDEKLAVSPLE